MDMGQRATRLNGWSTRLKTRPQGQPTTGRNIVDRWVSSCFIQVLWQFGVHGSTHSTALGLLAFYHRCDVLQVLWGTPSSTLQTSLIHETSMNWSGQNAAQGAESGEFQHRLFTKGRFKGHITFECTTNTYIEYIKLQCITQNYTTATATLQLKVAHVAVVVCSLVWVSHKPHSDFGGLMSRLFLALKMSRKKNLKHEIWWNVHAVMKRSFGNCLTNTLCMCTIKRDEMTCVYDLCDTGCILETASYVFGVWSQGWGFGCERVESIAMQNAHLNKLNDATCITNLSRQILFVSCDVYYIYI